VPAPLSLDSLLPFYSGYRCLEKRCHRATGGAESSIRLAEPPRFFVTLHMMKPTALLLRHSTGGSLLIRGFVFIFILLLFACFALPQTKAISSDDQAVRDAALRWLSLLDTGHYRQAFDEWPPRLKAASLGRDYFVKWMETRRVPLGRARGRLLYKVSHYHSAIGMAGRGLPTNLFQNVFRAQSCSVGEGYLDQRNRSLASRKLFSAITVAPGG
jgi:hypothetical protein